MMPYTKRKVKMRSALVSELPTCCTTGLRRLPRRVLVVCGIAGSRRIQIVSEIEPQRAMGV